MGKTAFQRMWWYHTQVESADAGALSDQGTGSSLRASGAGETDTKKSNRTIDGRLGKSSALTKQLSEQELAESTISVFRKNYRVHGAIENRKQPYDVTRNETGTGLCQSPEIRDTNGLTAPLPNPRF
jgi:hypothetical protein